MISFKQFISESFDVVETDDVDGWCEKYAPVYSERLIKDPSLQIYRGFSREPVVNSGRIDTNNFNRTASATSNYLNLWMSTTPIWNDFPRRDKAYICTTAHNTADGYGKVHVIIPADDAKIGICPSDDIWDSFTRFTEKYLSFPNLNYQISLGAPLIKPGLASLAQTDPEALTSLLQQLTVEVFEKVLKRGDVTKNESLDVIKAMNDYRVKTIADLLDVAFDPIKNGFTVATGATYSGGKNREIWIQGKVLVLTLPRFYRFQASKTIG